MKAAVFYGPNDLKLETVDLPRIGANEVLIRTKFCGICGTDPHIYRGRFPAPFTPVIPGHEFSGEVVQVGDAVDFVKIGDKVTADINVSCGSCYYCARGQKLFCPNIRQIGVHVNGAFAEYVKAPLQNVYKLPDEMSYEHGAYVEPLACVIHGQDKANIMLGDCVAIIGAGPMGLSHIQLANLSGASIVIVSETVQYRAKKALEVGADYVIDSSKIDPVEEVRKLTAGRGADVVIEAVGSQATYEQAFRMARRGGRITAFGAAPLDAKIGIKPFDIYAWEWTISGSYAGSYDTWIRAIGLLSSKKFKVDPLITHKVPLTLIHKGYELIEAKHDYSIKILVSPDLKEIEKGPGYPAY